MGRFFEEFVVGEVFESHSRTITEAEISTFAGLTGDFNPLHVDEETARQSSFGVRIAHGPMMIGMAFGLLSRFDLIDGTVLALKAVEWRFDGPVKLQDTVRVRATVAETRVSRKHDDRGNVVLEMEIINQDDSVVQVGKATLIMKSRPA